jgi:hypothetical protein
MKVGSVIVLSIVLGVAAGRPTEAAAPPEPAGAIKAEARQRFDRGLKLFESGDHAAALAEFKRAYELIPNPVVMYNVGLVYASMNRPVDAADALDLALASGGAALSADQRRHAQATRDEQATHIGQVAITTDPAATIAIDGVDVGTTPLAAPLRIPSGRHTLAARATGYLPTQRELMLAGQVTETLALTLLPAETTVAHLTITASPIGAEVLVNGKPVGLTPLVASVAVAPGPTRVEVRRSGYRTATRDLTLDRGASGAVDVTLEEDAAAARGRLRLAVSEPEVQVTVDGAVKVVGRDWTLRLPAGPHVLKVESTGFQPAERRVEVAANQDASLTVKLAPTLETRTESDDRARARKWRDGLIVGGGVAIAIAAGVYAIVTRHDVSGAQGALDAQLAMKTDPNAKCYYSSDPSVQGRYDYLGCPAVKDALQSDLDNARLRRSLAYGTIALGAVVAAVGAYLWISAPPDPYRDRASSQIGWWTGGGGGGVTVGGRF